MKALLAILLVPLAMAGCAINPSPTTAIQGMLSEDVPICRTDRECEAGWTAAHQWITSHSTLKLKSFTGTYMETGASALGGFHAKVGKQPQPDGSFKIRIDADCGAIWGCFASPVNAMVEFNSVVREAIKSKTIPTAP